MDTVYCSHRCLVWSLLIILLNQCMEVSSAGRECPQGQLQRIKDPYIITCCYPTRCGVGFEVRPCSINGTHDTCQMCPAYQNQSLRTSSFTMEPCSYWPLDKDCKSVHNHQRNTNDERTRRCMCNIELGKRFLPPESQFPGAPMDSYCQRRTEICKPGHEPVVDGNCRQCQPNYFKSVEGHTLCEPKTKCHLLGLNYVYTSTVTTADNNCSQPDPITTPKPYLPETVAVTVSHKPSPVVSSPPTTAVSTSTQDTGHYDSSRDIGNDDDNNVAWPVVGVVVFLVILVLFIGFIMFWRKRKGKSVWVCATNKNCTDPEKNYSQGSNPLQADLRSKHNLGSGCVIPQHLTDGDKVTNNNVTGGLPCHMGYLPNGQANGNIRHAHFSSTEHGNGDARSYCVSPLQPLQYHLIPASRPGILRGSNHNVVFGQSQGNVRDRSIDSIGQEKLQVHVDELEANPDVGENDPLLVPDHLHGATPCHVQNLGATLGHSPQVVQAGVNPLHLLAYGGPARSTFGPTFVHSGASSPPVQAQGPIVTCAPATGAVTFTRSTSVIASPEGEVDEDEIEARLPRLSQLLTEGENSTLAQSDQSAGDFFRADSPGRETTQQLRAPSQRLRDQFHPPKNGNLAHQQPHLHGIYSAHQRPGFPPAVVEHVFQRGALLNQPDHRIMNLKEQQLAESFNSTSDNPATHGQQIGVHDVSATDTPKTVVSSPEESEQTHVKTQLPPAVNSDFFTGIGMHLKTPKAGSDSTLATEPKQVDTGRSGENFVDRKRHVSGGAHVQNSSDRKRVPSSGSNSSSQSTLERQAVPSADPHRPCIKNSSPEEGDNTTKRHHHYNRTVSFEEEECSQPGNRQRGPSTESRSSAKSSASPEDATNECRYRGPMRSVSDPEQKNTADTDSDCDETERKCVSLEYDASNGSSKCSVNSDFSGTDSSGGSPCRTALYRRSHSENAAGSTDSAHKPPPRSMSEEKPQKLDRPIAKVKPMPASDNAVNQLPSEASDDARITSPLPVASVAPNTNAAPAHEHTSDDSNHEDSPGSNNSTREERDTIRESEEESQL